MGEKSGNVCKDEKIGFFSPFVTKLKTAISYLTFWADRKSENGSFTLTLFFNSKSKCCKRKKRYEDHNFFRILFWPVARVGIDFKNQTSDL